VRTCSSQREMAMKAEDMTLGDFVQQLLLQLSSEELHFRNERPCHELFYRLKTEPDREGKPHFLKDLFFDWNGPYPRSQELSEYLHGLHWTGCLSAPNPTYDRFTLSSEVGNIWRQGEVEPSLLKFMAEAGKEARDELIVGHAS